MAKQTQRGLLGKNISLNAAPGLLQLVMIPGINNSARLWDNVTTQLPAWVQTHAVDCPPLDNVEAIADALLETLPKRFCLAGFSFGGYVALAMLAKAPERISGLALINTNAASDTDAQRVIRGQSIAKAQAGEHKALVDATVSVVFHADSLKNESIKKIRTQMVSEYGAERFIAHLQASMSRPERNELISQLDIPALVVAADQDQVITTHVQKAMADSIPQADYKTIQRAGHMMPLEKPAELAHTLGTWLDKHRDGLKPAVQKQLKQLN
jgi:pimeloyl-ACP methyl ester carboxylesterase